ALLFMAIFWGRAGKRFGGRRTMAFAYFAMAAMLFAAGGVGAAAPLLTAAFLLCGALFTIALDALGSTAFMRSVRSYERAQMAAVY
ncbi:MAG: MFS transporter, partial [Mesorhizobium sp.]